MAMQSVHLTPKAGFCVKTSTLAPAVLPPQPSPKSTVLEPPSQPTPIPKGLKVFINIAWDPNVPPPPDGSEDAIQRAMLGEEDIDDANPEGWYVPVIVSPPRQDVDKAGKPSLVFDCVYNTTVKSRTLRDPEFKLFLVELGLQRIEARTGIALSRDIGTPNIASKGKLLPRTANIPAVLLQKSQPQASSSKSTSGPSSLVSVSTASDNVSSIPSPTTSTKSKPLIEEITSSSQPTQDPSLPNLKGILKSNSPAPRTSQTQSTSETSPQTATATRDRSIEPHEPLSWSWSKVPVQDTDKQRLKIDVHVPGPALTHAQITASTLDISARSLRLAIPPYPPLDLDLGLSDAEIAARVASRWAPASSSSTTTTSNTTTSSKPSASGSNAKANGPTATANAKEIEEAQMSRQTETTQALQLKRQRDFDVDAADAEWKIGTGVVEIFL